MVSQKANNAISVIKANRLFWMGRYAERVYLALHLLRRHHDLMIDEDREAYKAFCTKMGIEDKYSSPAHFVESYLYDLNNPDSVINMLESVNDNAILLREEIKSETLSYIQMAINYMKHSKEQSKGLGSLQYITDCILAFWGSADERICTANVRKTIFFGKFAECSDILIRFEYPLDRIIGLLDRIKGCVDCDLEMYNEAQLRAYESQLYADSYKDVKTLSYLNAIFSA
ncbi:MAG: hypothetical protein BGN96_02280 [Bacteroidales bacterium 45-6]|nr:MAG: hypothetical protein BGN96_02280 [Bacteroidales bacterium 45-6]